MKDEDIKRGVAQNDAQLVVGRLEYKYHLQDHLPDLKEISKKRKYLGIYITSIPSFGIVSSGLLWIFQRLVEESNQTTIPSTSQGYLPSTSWIAMKSKLRKNVGSGATHCVYLETSSSS